MSSTTNVFPRLTELDHARLSRLVDPHGDHPVVNVLAEADIIPGREIPSDVVTMYSQVSLQEANAAAPIRVTLCYPKDADAKEGFISVLSPMGAALLGQPIGETVTWQPPSGEPHSATILGIAFQPEASGDYTL